MEQYISKSALAAELKKRIRDYWSDSENTMGIYPYALEEVIKYIDTLEVKEVDLEKEFNDFLNNVEGVPQMWHSDEQIEWAKDIAKHFFELGIKAQNKDNE